MKRGQGIGLIPKLVIAALIIVLLSYMLGYTFTGAKPNLTTQNKLQQQVTACQLSASRGFTDTDKDGLANYCDPCPSGSDKIQTDADFLADGCDVVDNLAAKSAEEACCGGPVAGATLEEKQKNCPRLIGNDEYFQCDPTKAGVAIT